MDKKGGAKRAGDRTGDGGMSKKWCHGPSPQYSLVGNYLTEEVKGQIFPETPVPLQFECVVHGNACLATKGRGRLFVPTDVLKVLGDGKPRTEKLFLLCAAPGVPPIPELNSAELKCRSDLLQARKDHYNWYYEPLVQAIKPVSDYVSKKYGDKSYLFAATSFVISATWCDIFHICQQQLDADLIYKPTLTAQCD